MSSLEKLSTYTLELESVESKIEENITTLRRLNITNQSDPNFISSQISTLSETIEDLLEKCRKLYNKINNLTKNDPSVENSVSETKKKHKEIIAKLRASYKQSKTFIETKAKGLNDGKSSSTTTTNSSTTTSATALDSNNSNSSSTTNNKSFFPFSNKLNEGKNNSSSSGAAAIDEDDVVEVKRTSDADVMSNMYKGNANLTQEQRKKHDEIEKELFAEVFSTQKECLDIIDRLNKKSEETIALATDSADLLRQQREQLRRIDEEMDALGSNVKRAQKEITSFMRRIQTDKCCAVLCLLVALAILGGCIFAIVMKFVPLPNNNNNNNNNNNKKTNSTANAVVANGTPHLKIL